MSGSLTLLSTIRCLFVEYYPLSILLDTARFYLYYF